MPILSVIVPIYNSEKYITNLLEMFSNQLNNDSELIIVDDGSTDRSYSICEEFVQANNNIKLVSQKNSGASAARNRGIDLAQGDYITFVDSDDMVSEDYVETVLRYCKSIKADIIQFNYWIDANSEDVTLFDYKEFGLSVGFVDFKEYGSLLILQKVNALWNKAFKASVIKDNDIRCPLDVTIGEDACFVTDLLYYTKTIFFADVALYKYRITPGSITNAGKLCAFSDYNTILSKYEKFNNCFDIIDSGIIDCSSFADCVAFEVIKLSSSGYSNSEIRKAINESGILKKYRFKNISGFNKKMKHLLVKMRLYKVLNVIITGKKKLIDFLKKDKNSNGKGT